MSSTKFLQCTVGSFLVSTMCTMLRGRTKMTQRRKSSSWFHSSSNPHCSGSKTHHLRCSKTPTDRLFCRPLRPHLTSVRRGMSSKRIAPSSAGRSLQSTSNKRSLHSMAGSSQRSMSSNKIVLCSARPSLEGNNGRNRLRRLMYSSSQQGREHNCCSSSKTHSSSSMTHHHSTRFHSTDH